jgi:hypothetical protein
VIGKVFANGFAFLVVGVATAMFAADQPSADSTQLPPVYFNHSDIVLDPAAYDAIAQSPFLKEQFSGYSERSVQRDNGAGTCSYTFIGIRGRQTYLAVFKPNQTLPRDRVAFNMWIDDRTKLSLVRDSLARETHTNPEIRPSRVSIDGRSVIQLDSTHAEFPSDPAGSRATTGVISMYPDFLRTAYPDIKPEQEGTTREKNEAAYGHAIRASGEKQIATGPGIEFVLLSAEPGSPRKLAIDMKLNRPKTGDLSYQFGGGSELRFNGDTATWYFPAGWRP